MDGCNMKIKNLTMKKHLSKAEQTSNALVIANVKAKETKTESSFSCPCPISSQQAKGLFFLCLMASAGERAINRDDARNICTRAPGLAANIPEDTMFVVNQANHIVPKACLDAASEECQQELAIIKEHNAQPKMTQMKSILQAQRGEEDLTLRVFKDAMNSKVAALKLNLSIEEQIIFNNIMNNLSELKVSFLKHEAFKSSKVGNCGEFTKYALIELLKLKIDNKLDLKIHTVWVRAKATQEEIAQNSGFLSFDSSGRKPPEVDHNFLLIDSNMEMGNVKGYTAQETAAILRSITGGEVCDPWNDGFMHALNAEGSELYNSGRWETIEISSADFKFSKLDRLPLAFRRLICDELDAMGMIGIEENNVCSSASVKVTGVFGLRKRF